MWVAAGHFQVLWCNAVADVAGLFHAARLNEGTAVVHRFGNDHGARQGGQQLIDGGLHLVDVGCIRAQQNALC